MNKMNTYPHLTAWCEKYYERCNLKVHPSSVPVDVVLDEVMGDLFQMKHLYENVIGLLNHAVHRIDMLETQLMQQSKLTKIPSKVDKKEVKK